MHSHMSDSGSGHSQVYTAATWICFEQAYTTYINVQSSTLCATVLQKLQGRVPKATRTFGAWVWQVPEKRLAVRCKASSVC